MKVGMGEWEPERMTEILEGRDRKLAGPTGAGQRSDAYGDTF